MTLPERSAERDAAIDAMLPLVPSQGWSMATLRAALGPGGDAAGSLFPGGAADLIETFADLADRRMIEDAAAADFSGLRTAGRVRAVIALRMARMRPHRGAVRRAVGFLALPRHARLAACTVARTADAIWHAAGDRSADFSWYTKRGLLAGAYAATLLFWLRDDDTGDAATLAFLDRRLEGIGRIGRFRGRAEAAFGRACQRFRPSPPDRGSAGEDFGQRAGGGD